MINKEDETPLFSQASVPLTGSDDLPPTLPSDPALPVSNRSKGASLAGQRLGAYELLKELGRGTFGRVYLARDTHTDRMVAIKVREGDGELGLSEGFLHEAKSIARLEHPSIVRLMHVDETINGIGYIVYEYVQGKTLDQYIKPTLATQEQMAEWIASIADALDFAHRCGVIHRDVSPRNIMINENGQAKLLDFGLSRLDGGFYTSDKDSLMGTPHFMSPEQASRKPHWATAYSDLFSLGSVLYYSLTGSLPFQGTSERDILEQIQSSTPASLRSIREGVSIACEEVCLKAMSNKPQQRFSTGGDFARALRKAIASKKGNWASTEKQSVWPMVLGGGLLLVGIGCILGAWMQFAQSNKRISDVSPALSSASPVLPPVIPPGPKIQSFDVKVLLDGDAKSTLPLVESLPLPPNTARVIITPGFNDAVTSQYFKYLLVFHEPTQRDDKSWNKKQFHDDSESIGPSEIATWLSPGANLILVGVTDKELTKESLADLRVPFTKTYRVAKSDNRRYTISHQNGIPEDSLAKTGAIVLSSQKLPFKELEIDSSFKQQLLGDLQFQSYFGVIFGMTEKEVSN